MAGSLNGPMLWSRPNRRMRTPRRDSACPSSKPITPAPNTATDSGRSSQSKTSSLIINLSPAASNILGMLGLEPTASTNVLAVSKRPEDSSSVWSSLNVANSRMRCFSSKPSTASNTKPTNLSLSLLTRCMTARPSISVAAFFTPKILAS